MNWTKISILPSKKFTPELHASLKFEEIFKGFNPIPNGVRLPRIAPSCLKTSMVGRLGFDVMKVTQVRSEKPQV